MVYHIVEKSIWESFENQSEYFPSSFDNEGFIHFSFDHQVEKVRERYYLGKQNLLLLEIDENLLGSEYVVEASTKGELYPHLYKKLEKVAIKKITELL
ncbi:MAG: DUF952 domain-containing protein [Leadbetterella sp.]